MSRFNYGNSVDELFDGSLDIYTNTVKVGSLVPRMPVKTNSSKILVSETLSLTDIDGLADKLTEKNKLDFIHTTSSTPETGKVRLIAKSDNFLYTIDELGTETKLGSSSSVGSTWSYSDILNPGTPVPISNGEVRFNNATLSSSTEIYINTNSSQGNSARPILELASNGDTIFLCNANDSNCKLYQITASADNTTYFTLQVFFKSETDTANYTDGETLMGTLHVSGNPFDQTLNTGDNVQFGSIKTEAGGLNNHIELLKDYGTVDKTRFSMNLFNSQNDVEFKTTQNFKHSVENKYDLDIVGDTRIQTVGKLFLESSKDLKINARNPDKIIRIQTGGSNKIELIDNVIDFKNLGGGINFKNDIDMFNNDILNIRDVSINRNLETPLISNTGNIEVDADSIMPSNRITNLGFDNNGNRFQDLFLDRRINFKNETVNIGSGTGLLNQTQGATAIGNGAGFDSQGGESIAIGRFSGRNNQGDYSVAIGANSGFQDLPNGSIALGENAFDGIIDTQAGFWVGRTCIKEKYNLKLLYYDEITGEITKYDNNFQRTQLTFGGDDKKDSSLNKYYYTLNGSASNILTQTIELDSTFIPPYDGIIKAISHTKEKANTTSIQVIIAGNDNELNIHPLVNETGSQFVNISFNANQSISVRFRDTSTTTAGQTKIFLMVEFNTRDAPTSIFSTESFTRVDKLFHKDNTDNTIKSFYPIKISL